MTTNGDATVDPAEVLLASRKVYDINSYGWWNEDQVDQKFVGYAMWDLNPPYEQDFDSWEKNVPPLRAPTERDAALLELGSDFSGLMKTARHFIGQALVDQPEERPLRIEPSRFDYAEFAALAALVAAADRLRDLLIVNVLGTRKAPSNDEVQAAKERKQSLNSAYAALEKHGFGEEGGDLRKQAGLVSGALRRARNEVIHGLATRPAQVQRRLLDMERQAFESGTWNRASEPVMFDEVDRHGRDSETEELSAIEQRVALLCEWYLALVDIGHRSFRLEYHYRNRAKFD